MSFSKRMGLEPEQKSLQLDGIDNELKIEIYNVKRYFNTVNNRHQLRRNNEKQGTFCWQWH